MKIILSYKGDSYGVTFTPILPMMFARELAKLGYKVELVRDKENYEYDGSPSDNIYLDYYQELLELINSHYEENEKITFKDLEVDYTLSPDVNVAGVLTAFGCANHCKFCPLKDVKFTPRPLDKVIQELDWVTKYNDYFEFTDNSVMIDWKNFREVIKHIPHGVRWGALINLEDAFRIEELELMRAYGCVNLYVGVESFNPEDLKYFDKPYYNKGVDPKKALMTLKSMGFDVQAFLIRGLPNQTAEEFSATEEWLKAQGISDFVSLLHINGEYVKATDYYNEDLLQRIHWLDEYANRVNFQNFISKYHKVY